jgi:hypothetical protein
MLNRQVENNKKIEKHATFSQDDGGAVKGSLLAVYAQLVSPQVLARCSPSSAANKISSRLAIYKRLGTPLEDEDEISLTRI